MDGFDLDFSASHTLILAISKIKKILRGVSDGDDGYFEMTRAKVKETETWNPTPMEPGESSTLKTAIS